jgi:hypothetical protein
MKNSVLQRRTNPLHRFSPQSVLLWFNPFEVPFSSRNRRFLPHHLRLRLHYPVKYRNQPLLLNLQLVDVTAPVYLVFTMYCKQESIVGVATLLLNTIGGIAPFAAIVFD